MEKGFSKYAFSDQLSISVDICVFQDIFPFHPTSALFYLFIEHVFEKYFSKNKRFKLKDKIIDKPIPLFQYSLVKFENHDIENSFPPFIFFRKNDIIWKSIEWHLLFQLNHRIYFRRKKPKSFEFWNSFQVKCGPFDWNLSLYLYSS